MGTEYNLWLTMQEQTQKSEHFETVGGTIGLVLYNKKQIWQKHGKSVLPMPRHYNNSYKKF